VDAYDLKPKIVVEHGESIYDVILETAKVAGVDLIVVGSHPPAMKDCLLGISSPATRDERRGGCRLQPWRADMVCRRPA
jgi:nucleotide-binding universal stress UspA family protein